MGWERVSVELGSGARVVRVWRAITSPALQRVEGGGIQSVKVGQLDAGGGRLAQDLELFSSCVTAVWWRALTKVQEVAPVASKQLSR
jgi:hypothetical protein